jgi:hypothetical protein
MMIRDETLSAFLDQELPEPQMQQLRDAIAGDPALSERLAQLAAVDSLVKRHAKAVDGSAIPDGVKRRLAPDNVLHPGVWRRARVLLREHSALAASLALLVGFSAGYLGGSGVPADSAVPAAWLDSITSGREVAIDGDRQLLTRFSFVDNQQRYCRQYQLQSGSVVSENVACRQESDWVLMASAQISSVYPADEYQLASGTKLLDSTLDAMMRGQAMSLEDEEQLIRQRWQ